MPAHAKERKSKFTASVREKIVDLLDKKAIQLKTTRSDVVETALEFWLSKQAEIEEEAYYAAAAQEMNKDARNWNSTTTGSARRNWK